MAWPSSIKYFTCEWDSSVSDRFELDMIVEARREGVFDQALEARCIWMMMTRIESEEDELESLSVSVPPYLRIDCAAGFEGSHIPGSKRGRAFEETARPNWELCPCLMFHRSILL